ncbi:MAG: hypothetical protein ABH829_03145 [archaeon]
MAGRKQQIELNLNIHKEHVFLGLVILVAAMGFITIHLPFTNGQIDRSYPAISMAVDNGYHVVVSKYIYDSGDVKYWPAFVADNQQSVSLQPPAYYVFVASFARFSGLSVYDSAFLLTSIGAVSVCLSVYALTRKYFGERLALLALVLGAIPISVYWYFPIHIGFQLNTYAWIFVPAILFLTICVYERQEWWAAPSIALMLSAQFLSHLPEFYLSFAFFAGMSLIAILLKKERLKILKVIGLAFLLLLLLVVYYAPLQAAEYGYGGSNVRLGQVWPPSDYFPTAKLELVFWPFALLGVLFFGDQIYRKKLDLQRTTVLLFILYTLTFSMSYLIGFNGTRTYKQFFLGHPFYVLLPAAGVYLIYYLTVKTILPVKEIDHHHSNLLFALLIIAIAVASAYSIYPPLKSIGENQLMNPELWEGIQWVNENTPQDSTVLAFVGFRQFTEEYLLRKKMSSNLDKGYTIYNIQPLCQGQFIETYLGTWNLYAQTKNVRKSFFNIERTPLPAVSGGQSNDQRQAALADFDYVITVYNQTATDPAVSITGVSIDPCMHFYLNEMVNRGHYLVFMNSKVAVIEVNKDVL